MPSSIVAVQVTGVIAVLGLLYGVLMYSTAHGALRGSNPRTAPSSASPLPLAINTWFFSNATRTAYRALQAGGSALDAVEGGCGECEQERCDGTVGYGGSPDGRGETTLDAMIMDGSSHDVGAVGALRGIKAAISVARHVLHNTRHSILVGSQATQFAVQMGFKVENLTTTESAKIYDDWIQGDCQPNYWKNVIPSPESSCGPYHPSPSTIDTSGEYKYDGHDTIAMVAIDKSGRISCGTSSNGANHKIPGRVGDAPIAGSGCYVDKDIGGAAATGDGDTMMRFLPTLVAVEAMRFGLDPTEAASTALSRIIQYYPKFQGGIIAAFIDGEYGAACHGFSQFEFSIGNPEFETIEVVNVPCSYSPIILS